MSDLPAHLSPQAQLTDAAGRATREFFGFLQRFLQWADDGAAMNSVAVADLPDAASNTGARYLVTDANATTFASTVAAGGANIVPVYSNGTDWKIG